jgi:hypothetical protein
MIEGYHRQIKKVAKSKEAFTGGMALLKLIYLATERIAQNGQWPYTDGRGLRCS